MLQFIKSFLQDENGTTSVEYAVMLAMILISVIAAIGTVGSETGGLWGTNSSKLDDVGFGS